jgi:D-3-phosphoglycerate dehydrogenase
MNKPRILVTTQMMIHNQPRFLKWLNDEGFEVDFVMNKQFLSERECLKLPIIYDGWIAGDDQITKPVINHLNPKLRIISKWGTGIDSIDLNYCKSKGILVKNSPGAFADAVGEIAVAYVLALSRGIVKTHINVLNRQWPKTQYKTLTKSKIGIVGMGHIGKATAKRLECFVDSIYYSDPKVLIDKYIKMNLDMLMSKSDFIILTCDLNESTYHLINFNNISLLKKNAFLINVSRGHVVDEQALIKAIKENKMAGAALDVFEKEPIESDSDFLGLENVILGSHNANNTTESVEFVNKNTIKHLVNFFNF